ncbi:uncharacterized protein [Rutidosis leptorrhynchoides]|uniref:uncharacterized protein isoform X2 n=1 Tax=Rutidosis leptorrhynchoides TaxID=125765 RepID=UPI003A98E20A
MAPKHLSGAENRKRKRHDEAICYQECGESFKNHLLPITMKYVKMNWRILTEVENENLMYQGGILTVAILKQYIRTSFRIPLHVNFRLTYRNEIGHPVILSTDDDIREIGRQALLSVKASGLMATTGLVRIELLQSTLLKNVY